MHSSGFILGIANCYHGYRFAVEWQRHSCTGDSVAPAAARHNIFENIGFEYVQGEYPFFARDMIPFLVNIKIYTSKSYKSEEGITFNLRLKFIHVGPNYKKKGGEGSGFDLILCLFREQNFPSFFPLHIMQTKY
jgi:hypothetical protein